MFINTEYMRRPYSHYNRKNDFSVVVPIAGLSLRAGGWGFSPATKRVAPGYFYWKIVEK